jgi:hypothetical protein
LANILDAILDVDGGAGCAVAGSVYDFIKIHRTLRVTPAMEAKIVSRPFGVMDLVSLLIEAESKKAA